MKILIIHYRYHLVGGPERYLFNVSELLTKRGHTVVPFSINYEKNIPSKYNSYFVEPIGERNSFSFSEQTHISLSNKMKIVKTFFYNQNAYKNLNEIIKIEKPDVVYVLQFLGKLSISIFDACFDNKVPIVLRLSDYGLLCSKNIFYRNGKVCTKCLSNQLYGIKNKCVRQSYLKSILNYSVLQFSYIKKFQSKIFHIITPSLTMKEIFMKSKQFKNNKISHIPTFSLTKDFSNFKSTNDTTSIDFCYFGRIDEDKGVETIIRALILLSNKGIVPKVLIIGAIDNPYARTLIDNCKKMNFDNIKFTGLLNKNQLINIIQTCKISIIPSLWFDNMPNSLIESQAAGLPVIASKIGSLPELITEDYNGFLFEPGNAISLAIKMERTLTLNNKQLQKLKINSSIWAREYCSEEKHYDKLINIFNMAKDHQFMQNHEKNN